MSERSPWLDPRGIRAALALALIAAAANGIWIFLDHTPPSWDQSNYLGTALQYQHSFQSGGLGDLIQSIHSTDPGHAPLFPILILPFIRLFGPEGSSALYLNLLIAPVLYFAAGQIAWIVFRSWIARLLAIALVATMPILVGLYHEILVDFLLVTLVTLSLLLLLETQGFRRRGMAVALGVAMALGTLTKVTFPMFIAGPLLVVIAQILVARRRAGADDGTPGFDGRLVAKNAGFAALAYVLVIAPWFGPNLGPTLDYVSSTTSGPLALGAGPSNPYTFHAVTSFTVGMINYDLSWVIFLAGAIAAALSLGKLRRMFARPRQTDRLLRLAFVLAWVVIPYLSVALAHNQDVRLMAAAMPGMAVLVAGALSAIRWAQARLALVGALLAFLIYQSVNHLTEITPSFLPDDLTVTVGSYVAVIPLDSRNSGYLGLPGDDYATPVIEQIERVAAREPGGAVAPRTVCLLQSEAVVNINTFTYLAATREDPYQFADVVTDPTRKDREDEFAKILSGCDFALYVPQPKPEPGDESRLTLVNAIYAANYMTPRLFRMFDSPSRSFPLGSTPEAKGEPEYLSPANREDQVTLLVRKRTP